MPQALNPRPSTLNQVELPRDLLMCEPEWSGGEVDGGELQLESDLIAGFHDGPFVAIECFEDIPVAVRKKMHPFMGACIHLWALSVTPFPPFKSKKLLTRISRDF